MGPSATLNRDPTSTPSVNNTTQTVPQLRIPQQSATSQPPHLVCRGGQLQEQGFSVEVAERIAVPQRSSTRIVYQSKWALFAKWCRENSVDFSTPSVKQITDFFMYLYQDLNRHHSTINGYRTAIVDTLGPMAQHTAHDAHLHRLLSSFHRDRPKSSRWGIGGPDHASVSLESSQHVYQFLLKRSYLLRQQQQYVSGTSSSGTPSPRPFPSASSSLGRKEVGHASCIQVFRSLSQGLGIRYLSKCSR